MILRSTNWLDAVDPKHSVWVAANAGSGKTHTLANRVTRLLLEGVKPEKILCLTFTKAAAAEMQHRLFKQLGDWAMLDDPKLRAEIAAIGGEAPDKRELAKARRLFALALETPGGLKIQTLHGFCERLLTRFPLEAGVPASFQVLDDPTAHELTAEARADVLDRAGRGEEPLASAAALIATHSGEQAVAEMLKVAMGSDRGKLDAFVADKSPEQIATAIATAHGVSPGDTYESIARKFCTEMQREESQIKTVAEWLNSGGKTDQKASARIALLTASGFAPEHFDDFVLSLLTKDGDVRTSLASKKLQTARPDLLDYAAKLAERMRVARERGMAARAAALAQAAIVLACAARGIYTRAKQVRGVLDYGDLIASSVALLERGNAAAWVLYKLDQGIDHILIDEAQDTSPEQWRIVKRLSGEFFAGDGARDGAVRTIFAVGDEKQSIFSFQGAAPREFGLNRHEFQHLVERAGESLREVDLVESRRSSGEVLDFVDKVFAGPARNGLTSGDEDIRHTPYRKQAKGRVEFWPVTTPNTDQEDLDYWMLPLDVERPDSPVKRLANEIALRIRAWCDSKTKLSGIANVKPEDDRPIRPGDIMILMPRREPFASEIIRRLKELNVPVAGADRIRLTQQIGVMDLIALGRFALLPEDDLNLASLLRSPLLGFSDEDLYALAQPRKGGLWRELIARAGERDKFTAAHDYLAQILKRADYAPPHEFYAQALGPERGREKLLKRLGPEAADAIDELLSLALTYEQLNVPSLEGFLHWIERGDAEIKRDMERGRDEVRVITVHGAKGLEAPIVILPDTARAPPPVTGRLILEDDAAFFSVSDSEAPDVITAAKGARKLASLQEQRRLLYVALTRARDRLYIHGFKGKRKLSEESWHQQIVAADPALAVENDEPHVVGDADTEPFAAKLSGDRRENAPLPDWARADAPAERVSPRLIRASDAAGLEEPVSVSPLTGDGAKRFQRGNLIHGLLARLPGIAPAQRREAALRYLRANQVDGAQAEKLTDETLAVLTDKQFAAAFAQGSRAEVALVAALPELGEGARLNGRIDRLAIGPDEILVVDFKTNRPPPPDAAHVATVYKAQMALYKAALSKVFPGRRITCALVWTDGPRLMPLPDAMLEAELGHIRARLDSPASTTKY